MNKAELAQKIADKVGVSRVQAEQVLDSFTEVATAAMKAGGEVTLTGFGTFSARARKGREGINPRNPSEKITIPTVVVAKFKAGKNLKDALKGKESTGQTAPAASAPAKPAAAPAASAVEAEAPAESATESTGSAGDDSAAA